MRTVFYPYVSSRADTPLVDKHDIERALDAWSWYWLLVEAIPLSLLGALVAACFASYSLLIAFGIVFTTLWLLAWLYYLRLERFSQPEIEAIAALLKQLLRKPSVHYSPSAEVLIKTDNAAKPEKQSSSYL